MWESKKEGKAKCPKCGCEFDRGYLERYGTCPVCGTRAEEVKEEPKPKKKTTSKKK